MAHYEFELDFNPGCSRSIILFLFKNVSNSKDLLHQLKEGSISPEFSIVNGALVVSAFPLLAAASKALKDLSRDALKTKTLHSELVYNYSASKHIRESLKNWGIKEDTKDIVVAKFDPSPQDVEDIRRLIQGEEVPFSEIQTVANVPHIKKLYKIVAEELQIGTLEDAIVSRIACRDSL